MYAHTQSSEFNGRIGFDVTAKSTTIASESLSGEITGKRMTKNSRLCNCFVSFTRAHA